MKRILGIAMVVLVLVFLVYGNYSRIDPAVPDLKVRELPPLTVPPSTITIPFSFPIQAIGDALEQEIPRTQDGTESWVGRILGIKTSISVDWRVERDGISISGGEDKIRTRTRLSAEVEARNVEIADITGNLRATMRPKLNSNWRLNPQLTTNINLSTANLLRFISVRGLLEPELNQRLSNISSDFNNKLSRDDFIEKAVRQQWHEICRSFPISPDSSIWLEVKPVAVRSAQPIVDTQNVYLQFSLDAETQIVETQTQPQCTFPDSLIIEDSQPGYFKIVLPAALEYDTLEAFLKKKFAGKTVDKDVSVRINAVNILSDGEVIVLGVKLTLKANGWFGPRAQGIVYLSAKPHLNVDRQEIILTKLQLDIESRNALVTIFGEAAESVLLVALGDEIVFDLSPKLEEARDRAQQALNAISTDELLVEGQLSEIRITSLDVGTDRLRLVTTAQGGAVASAKKISWSSN